MKYVVPLRCQDLEPGAGRFSMMKKLRAKDRLIVALDYTSAAPALDMARRLKGLAGTLKIGSILFTACGPSIVRRVRAMGFEVMLDLKFFDIPSTVSLACSAAVDMRVSMLTVHATGERMMLQAAADGVREQAKRARVRPPLVLAVTVLTSMDSGKGRELQSLVVDLACRAVESGCDGIVSSAQEAPFLRKKFGSKVAIVCPGIRPLETGVDDQKRVATPAAALAQGADWLVIGRPITASADPAQATKRILNEMEEAIVC